MRTLLNQDAFRLLRLYNIDTADYKIIHDSSELKNLSYPLVLKVNSPKIIHKTEQKAVQVLYSAKEVDDAFSKMRKMGEILYQPYIEGRQLILGIKKDPTFGQAIMFGLGGVFTEIFKDVSFRVCPISVLDARNMIQEIKAYKMLQDFRGDKAINFPLLEKTMAELSHLAVKENVLELDINPLIANEKNIKAVDARIVLA